MDGMVRVEVWNARQRRAEVTWLVPSDEFVHFCHADAVASILAHGLYGADSRAARGIPTIGGNGGSWNDLRVLGLADEADAISVYNLTVTRCWPNFACLPSGLVRQPADYRAIWFTADPAVFTDWSDRDIVAWGHVAFTSALAVSVDEGCTLLGTTLPAALARHG